MKVKKPKVINIPEDQKVYDEICEKDVPKWFRGLSQFQIEAADSLLTCLRDDSEQNTTHRVRYALLKLGIRPSVSCNKTRIAMRLSRGNDIAFLWFLMELYYRRGCDECKHILESEYSINEQLIMSTIVHLDLIPTLRELDKILPEQPEQPTPKKIKKKVKKQKNISPYFDKQLRPVLYGKKLTATHKDNQANFNEYANYLNPSYVVPNESNRWFTNYKFMPCEKLAAKTSKQQRLTDIFDQEVKGSSNVNPILCATITAATTLKESLFKDLEITKNKLIKKLYDSEGRLKDPSYLHVVEVINKEVEDAKLKYSQLSIAVTPTHCSDVENVQDKRNARKSTVSEQATYNENFTKTDYEYSFVPSAKTKICFEAAENHKPYKSVYQNNFNCCIEDPEKGSSTENNDEDEIDHSQAVRECAKRIWAAMVQKYKKDCIKEIDEYKKEKAGVRFDLPYYDPYNADLMKSMLHKAIEKAKLNKKLVLVTLPDAHRIPTLMSWIKKRYGYVYTRPDKKKAFVQAKRICTILAKAGIHVQLPQTSDISKDSNQNISYGCKKYWMRKINYVIEKYNHNFKASFLEHTRIYWNSIRPYQCLNGPPRSTFYAYLPARENDVHMFRPWKPNEHVPGKEEWDRRQRVLRQKEKLN